MDSHSRQNPAYRLAQVLFITKLKAVIQFPMTIGSHTMHLPVFPKESIHYLIQNPDGTYIDATFGRGGHSQLILAKLSQRGRLFAIDQDPDAIGSPEAQQLQMDPRFKLIQANFAQIESLARKENIHGNTQGILLDLGISSPQIDTAERGFSFQQDADLDMRMDTTSGQTAADWLNQAKETEIADVIYYYGEERFSRQIAKAIVTERKKNPIQRTQQLASIILSCFPPRSFWPKHPATRSFMAIRIFINRELEVLQLALEQSVKILAPAGRLVVISFHSLEDRIVKTLMREHARAASPQLKLIAKISKVTAEEARANPRARSAKLRVAEKIG